MKRQILRTAIGTKFAPPKLEFLWMTLKKKLLRFQFLRISQYSQPFLWFHFIDDIFFICTHGAEKPVQLLNELSNLVLHIKFSLFM